MRIYVGNLSYNVTEEELRQEFAAFGEVESVSLVTDRFSGRPRGFGFVDMPSKEEGDAAIESLNGKMLLEAKAHPERHRNLIVRVWGWSGYFCELAPEYQDHIIARHLYEE